MNNENDNSMDWSMPESIHDLIDKQNKITQNTNPSNNQIKPNYTNQNYSNTSNNQKIVNTPDNNQNILSANNRIADIVNRNSKQPEENTESYFDSTVLDYLGWNSLKISLSAVSIFFAQPWAECEFLKFKYSCTYYNDKNLKFDGTGSELYVETFKWNLLSIITLGIYFIFFRPLRKKEWIVKHTHFANPKDIKGESVFTGSVLGLFANKLLCNFLKIISLGLLVPLATCLELKYITNHTIIDGQQLIFTGKARNLFGTYIKWFFLTLITLGIYSFWLLLNMEKWTTKNIHIKLPNKPYGETKSNNGIVKVCSILIAIILAILGIKILLGVLKNGIDIKNPFEKKANNQHEIDQSWDNDYYNDDFVYPN